MEPQSPLSRRWGLQPGSGVAAGSGDMGRSGADAHAFVFEGALEGGRGPRRWC